MHEAEEPDAPANAPASTPADGYALLRDRDFLLYLIGRFSASFGAQMFGTAVGWEIYERTHRAFDLGLVGLTQIVPMYLFSLPSGHLSDNYNRKKIIMLMTVVMACANIGLAGVSWAGVSVNWIYLFLFIAASGRTFLWTATASFLPQLVARNKFSRAVNWNSGSFQVSAILGPIVSGALIGVCHEHWERLAHSAAPVYLLNALCAFICCVLMSFISKEHVVTVKEKMTLKNLLTGFNFVFSTRIISGIITLDMFAVLLGGSTALLPVYAKDILLVGPRGLGLLTAALPVGSVICAFILAHRPPLQKAGHTLLWAVTGFGLATIGFGLSRWFWLSYAMLFICGLLDNISVTVRHTLVQMLTPDEKRGRVSAVNNLFIGTSNELGEFESGTVAQWFGPVTSVVSGGIGTILVVVAVAFAWPEIRKYGRLDSGS